METQNNKKAKVTKLACPHDYYPTYNNRMERQSRRVKEKKRQPKKEKKGNAAGDQITRANAREGAWRNE